MHPIVKENKKGLRKFIELMVTNFNRDLLSPLEKLSLNDLEILLNSWSGTKLCLTVHHSNQCSQASLRVWLSEPSVDTIGGYPSWQDNSEIRILKICATPSEIQELLKKIRAKKAKIVETGGKICPRYELYWL